MSDLIRDVHHGHNSLELAAHVGQPPPSFPLRVSEDARRLNAWALVLVSRGFRPLVRWTDGVFELHVPHAEVAGASIELDAYDAEEQELERAARADAAREQRPATRYAARA